MLPLLAIIYMIQCIHLHILQIIANIPNMQGTCFPGIKFTLSEENCL
jgi:hypothetical protein